MLLPSGEFAPKTPGDSVIEATNSTLADFVIVVAAIVVAPKRLGAIVVAAILLADIVVAVLVVVVPQTLVQG